MEGIGEWQCPRALGCSPSPPLRPGVSSRRTGGHHQQVAGLCMHHLRLPDPSHSRCEGSAGHLQAERPDCGERVQGSLGSDSSGTPRQQPSGDLRRRGWLQSTAQDVSQGPSSQADQPVGTQPLPSRRSGAESPTARAQRESWPRSSEATVPPEPQALCPEAPPGPQLPPDHQTLWAHLSRSWTVGTRGVACTLSGSIRTQATSRERWSPC